MYRFKLFTIILLHLFFDKSISQECLNGNCEDGYGEYQYATGAVYRGEWLNGKRNGEGITTSSNGEIYEGEYKNDRRSGYGVYLFPSGERYSGNWRDGRRHGFGTLLYQNGVTEYVGYFQDGKITGTGRKSYANGNSYNGDWLNSKYHGFGVLTDNDGNQYTGTWNQDTLNEGEFTQSESENKYIGPFKDLKAHGKGKYYFNSGSWAGGVYEGNFEESKIQGRGTFTSSDGSVYIGDWINNNLVSGKLTTESGETYEGDFNGFNFNGYGTYIYQDGRIYMGEWNNNVRDGNGKGTFPDGAAYEGEWRNDKYHGNGTYTYKNGITTTGEFANGLLNGRGVIIWPDGDQFFGNFLNDKRSGYGFLLTSDEDIYINEWANDEVIDRDESDFPLELLESDKDNFISLSAVRAEFSLYDLGEFDYFEQVYDSKNIRAHLFPGKCLSNYDIYDNELHESLGVKKFSNFSTLSTQKLNYDNKKISKVTIQSAEFMGAISELLVKDEHIFCIILTNDVVWYGGTFEQVINEEFFFGVLEVSPRRFCDFMETSETFKSYSIKHNIGCVAGEIYRSNTNVQSYDNSKKSFGSGFFINNEGYFLTNHHTIDNCSLVEVNTGNMNYEAMIISEDEINDIAIGRIDIETSPSLKMSNDRITLGEKIIVAGFPLSGKLSDDVKINSGIVSGLSGMSNDSSLFQFDAAVQPGNSGGPVLNEYGEWIGIVASMATDDFFYEISGQYPENVNFAIKGSIPLDLINENKIETIKNFFLFRNKLTTEEVAILAKESAVHLTCTKK